MWVLGMELASRYPSGASNFVVAARFLENLGTTGLHTPNHYAKAFL